MRLPTACVLLTIHSVEREWWVTNEPLRCQVCGVRIGVYEPLTLRVDGLARDTAIAADPHLSAFVGEHYHRACYSSQFHDYAFDER
jgi:hypothetical protein